MRQKLAKMAKVVNGNYLALALFLGACAFIALDRHDPRGAVRLALQRFQMQMQRNEQNQPNVHENSHTSRRSGEDLEHILRQATSGNEFSGAPIRAFPDNMRTFSGRNPPQNRPKVAKKSHQNCTENCCKKWAVVTTIFSPPQEAVRRLLYRKEWCVVVVGDQGKPKVCHFYNPLMHS